PAAHAVPHAGRVSVFRSGAAMAGAGPRASARRSMTSPAASVLTINGGSSSIRFAVYEVGDTARRQVDGTIDRITDHRAAVGELVDRLEAEAVWPSVRAIGHRVVHGMKHTQPERITPTLL